MCEWIEHGEWGEAFAGGENTENGDTDKRWIKNEFVRQNQLGETTIRAQGSKESNDQGVREARE